MGQFDNKVVIVTGAGVSGEGMGNGKAAAIHYAREGAHTVALDIDQAALDDTAHIIASEGNAVTALLCDVSDNNSVADTVAEAHGKLGRIDVLHNNVGLLELDGPVALPEEVWDKVIDTNVKSMFLTCKHVLPIMAAPVSYTPQTRPTNREG